VWITSLPDLEHEFGKCDLCHLGGCMIATVPRPRRLGQHLVPDVLFEVRPLDKGMHVLIVDHPLQLRVLLDPDEHSEKGAHHLTLAVRENLAQDHWQRTASGLWTNG
jgi:hypothetical protein